MNRLMTIILFLVVSFFMTTDAFAGGWIYYTDGPYKGKVIELESGAPIDREITYFIYFVKSVNGLWKIESF